jgi:hypothetical protein
MLRQIALTSVIMAVTLVVAEAVALTVALLTSSGQAAVIAACAVAVPLVAYLEWRYHPYEDPPWHAWFERQIRKRRDS